jgi:serine-type D-Ala-D-Ala carboxypeptidase/endopeptidase (penicillin-binding protein 4)
MRYDLRIRYIIICALLLGSSFPAVFGQSVPQPTPSPTPSPLATPTPVPVQTLADLQAKIRTATYAPQLRRGRIGIKIVTLNRGTIVYENDAEKYFMPASNMKNFTVAAALERLTPDFRFVTRVRAADRPDAAGLIRGNLTIAGGGDVSISKTFQDDHYRGLDALAEKIKAAGVKRIEGDLIADQSYFRGFKIPASWEWDDLQWYHGAEVSALPYNDNVVDLNVLPGSVGNQCIVRILPQNTLYRIINKCVTGAAGSRRTLSVHKWLDQNVVEVGGSLPTGERPFDADITVSSPAELFVSLLKDRLLKIGVEVTGQARTMDVMDRSTARPELIEITRIESPPLALIAAKTMKPSQNMYTETLLWTLGEHLGRNANPNLDSSTLGINLVKDFLRSIGLTDDAIVQYDGSGLSRHNLITPNAVAQLYVHMAKQAKYQQAWRDSLTVAGVDGTLRNRFAGTAAAANMRGKTGTIDQVSALSGYVRTAGGEELVVSLVINGVAGETRQRTSVLDEIVVALANFNGRIDQ